MLPHNLVPAMYADLHAEMAATAEDKNSLLTDINDTLLDLEKKVLSSHHYAGQAKNSLLEENDCHLKDRLFCAVKIEAIYTVLNELVEQEKLSAADLQMVIEDKKLQISHHAQKIWVNQLTQEQAWPLFYSLED